MGRIRFCTRTRSFTRRPTGSHRPVSAVHVVGMAIVLPTDAVARRHLTERVCAACEQTRPIAEFEPTRDARGKHARRQVCTTCVTGIDGHLRSGLTIDVVTALTSAPVPLIRERHLAITAEQPTTATTPAAATPSRVCLACKRDVPVTGYSTTPTGAHRRVCEECRAAVDALLHARTPVAEIIRKTGVTRPTITERRRELGLPDVRRVMAPDTQEQILALAADHAPADIARQLGEDPVNVRRFLTRRGVIETNPAYGPVDPALLEQAAALLADETPYAEVARTTGIDVGTLRARFPGHSRTRDNRALMAWINMTPEVQALHREISRR